MTAGRRVLTCPGSVDQAGRTTGRCCVTDCQQPAPYGVLYDEASVHFYGPLREHLRCVEHAAQDREDQAAGHGYLVAMKALTVPAGVHR